MFLIKGQFLLFVQAAGTVPTFQSITGVLGYAKVLTAKAGGNGLTVVLAANVVVFGYKVVVNLGKVSLLIGSILSKLFPVIGKVLVG